MLSSIYRVYDRATDWPNDLKSFHFQSLFQIFQIFKLFFKPIKILKTKGQFQINQKELNGPLCQESSSLKDKTITLYIERSKAILRFLSS